MKPTETPFPFLPEQSPSQRRCPMTGDFGHHAPPDDVPLSLFPQPANVPLRIHDHRRHFGQRRVRRTRFAQRHWKPRRLARSASPRASALPRGLCLSLLCPFAHHFPKSLFGKALSFIDALPGAVEERLKACRAPQQETLQVIVIVRNEQHSGRPRKRESASLGH